MDFFPMSDLSFYEPDRVARLFFLFSFSLKFGDRPVDEFKLHTGVLIDVILVGEHFLDIFLHLLYLILNLEYFIGWHDCSHAPHSYESSRHKDSDLYGYTTSQYAGQHDHTVLLDILPSLKERDSGVIGSSLRCRSYTSSPLSRCPGS